MADIKSMTNLFSLASKRGLKPDVVTYTTLVQGLLRANRVDMAKGVLSKMLSEGLEPNERMCSLLVSDLARSGSQAGLQRAEEMMSEMRRKKMSVTQATWTSLISGYFRGGWETDAWSAVERMGRSGISLNRVGYNIILKQGQGRWCLKVFERMVKEGVSPNNDTFVIVLTPLVHKKQWAEADKVIQEMERLGFRAEKGTLSRLVSRVEARR
jgi:pentatricopeptide repeat protein